ncbi:MAG: hypothetical protein ABJO09_09925 [Hyphomicrobiales bacterium]
MLLFTVFAAKTALLLTVIEPELVMVNSSPLDGKENWPIVGVLISKLFAWASCKFALVTNAEKSKRLQKNRAIKKPKKSISKEEFIPFFL